MQPEASCCRPAVPREEPACLDLIKLTQRGVPMLGVCLGHSDRDRGMAGTIVRAPEPMQGQLSTIHHNGKSAFRGVNKRLPGDALSRATIAPPRACHGGRSRPPARMVRSRRDAQALPSHGVRSTREQ